MTSNYSITISGERKRVQHLSQKSEELLKR